MICFFLIGSTDIQHAIKRLAEGDLMRTGSLAAAEQVGSTKLEAVAKSLQDLNKAVSAELQSFRAQIDKAGS